MQLASANYISIFFINHANAFAVRSTILNYKRFQIIRDQKISGKIVSALTSIKLFSVRNIFIFCMIQQQIFHMKLLRQFAGILHC